MIMKTVCKVFHKDLEKHIVLHWIIFLFEFLSVADLANEEYPLDRRSFQHFLPNNFGKKTFIITTHTRKKKCFKR